MKIIFLAAGKGTRMLPLTIDTPKPMLKIKSKTLLDHKLESLPWHIEDFVNDLEEIIFIVGYKKEKIIEHFGNIYTKSINNKEIKIPIKYVEHVLLDGTAGAMNLCRDFITDRFFVLSGDDLYDKKDLENMYKINDDAMLICDMGEDGLKSKGQIITDNEGNFLYINEGEIQSNEKSSFINTGCYIITKDYFKEDLVKVNDTEYGLPHTLLSLTKKKKVKTVKAENWIQITSPEDIEKHNKL